MGVKISSLRGTTFPGQNIYEASETCKADIGQYFDLGDRRFRYAKDDGTGIALGLMTAATAGVANYTDQVQTAYGVTAGQRQVNVLLTTTVPTVDQFKNGYLICNKGTGLGQMYRIRGNSAAVTPCVVDLYDDVITTIPEASELTIMRNKWSSVCIFPTSALQPATGVTLVTVPAGYYFWAQTRGPAPLLIDSTATTVLGEWIGAKRSGMTVAGAGDVPAATDQFWGVIMNKATEVSEYAMVDLKLE
jgi:hypothetical protein